MDAVQIRKAVIFSIRTCLRSVGRHPFLVGMVFFLIFVHRSYPFMFSLLVSASPVFVSAAVLLGTLLSYGHANIPEIGREGKTTNEIKPLKNAGPRDASVVEIDDSYKAYNIERYTEDSRKVVEKSIDKTSSVATGFSDVDKDDSLEDSALLIEEKFKDYQYDKREAEGGRESPDKVSEKNDDLTDLENCDDELLRSQYSPIRQVDEKSVGEMENENSLEGYFRSEMVDQSTPPGPSWKQENEGEVVDDVSDSGSDRAESSSPDASMADIIPMLDELHPLLDEDAPQPAQMFHEGSDVTSEHSSQSYSGSSNQLDEDMENHREVGFDVEEDMHTDKEDETKSPIRWTEDDQKNLMHLGTSELERNQRLENLIVRRKSMKIMAEKNLIDFDGADLPFNVAPISTARQNPFDLPHDPNADMGLPGSAPSILAPGRNPFDMPYDSSVEKPDMMGDDFQQNTLHPKEPYFRRNETFNAGPSFFGTFRHEYKYRPYFVPERMPSEGPNFSPLYRQSSGLSDSKASSVPETESIGSVEDFEDKKPIEEDISQEPVLNSMAEHPSEEDFSQEPLRDSLADHPSADLDEKPIKEDFSQEPELGSIAAHPSDDVGHGSESSSEDEDSPEQGGFQVRGTAVDENEIILRDVEDYQEKVPSFSKTAVLHPPMEVTASESHLNSEVLESKDSSSSLLSEVGEKIFNEKEDETLSSFEPSRGDLVDSGISHMEQSDTDSSSQLVDDTRHKEPIYDSSPTALEKDLSSSSICSDLQVEIAETSLPSASAKRTNYIAENDPKVSTQISGAASEADEKVISAHFQSPSDKNVMLQSEKELPLSDQAVDEPSPRNPKEFQASTNNLNASEQHSFPVGATDSHGIMPDNIEHVDGVDEPGEGLPLELHNMGSDKKVGSDLNESSPESFHMTHDVENSSGTSSVKQVQSPNGEIIHREVDDPADSKLIDDEPSSVIAATEPAEAKTVKNPNAKEINSDVLSVQVVEIKDVEPTYEGGMPILEAQSLEDNKSAFDQVNEREMEKPTSESIRTELSPHETMTGYSENRMSHERSSSTQNSSDISGSIHDGHSEQHRERKVENPTPFGSKDDDADHPDAQYPTGTSSDVHVDKARSSDQMMQVSEGNQLPESDYDKESTDLRVTEVCSGNATESTSKTYGGESSSKVSTIDSSSKESGGVETSSDMQEKQPNKVEASRGFKETVREPDKKNSNRLSSGSISNSSSSSSSSDSDGE